VEITRGLEHACGMSHEPTAQGCGLHFCAAHLNASQQCDRCAAGKAPYKTKADHPKWDEWKLTDDSWSAWRANNPEAVARIYLRRADKPKNFGPVDPTKKGGA
jgi:hypothetical protein